MIASAPGIVLAGVPVWGGNDLVSFAIGRHFGTAPADIAPESTLSDAAVRDIAETRKQQAKQAETWVGRSAPEKVRVLSSDGPALSAEAVITDEASHPWGFVVHGCRSNHRTMFPPASLL